MSKRSDESDTSEETRKKEKEKKKKPKSKKLTDDELNNFCPVRLQETDTNTLLYIPSLIVGNNDVQLHQEVEQRNAAYEKLLSTKTGSDNFGNHAAQTFNYISKDKAQLTRINEDNTEENEVACQANEFEILHEASQPTVTYYDQLRDELNRQIEKEFQEKLKNPCLLPVDLTSIMQNAQPQMRKEGERGPHPDSDTSHIQSNLRGNTTRMTGGVKTSHHTKPDHLKDDESVMSSDQLSAQKTGSLVSKTVQAKSVNISEKAK